MNSQRLVARFPMLDALLRSHASRALERVRGIWSRPGAREDTHTERYFELLRDDSSAEYVDDRTWQDLEFSAIFHGINNTITPLGSQYLYRRMRCYVRDAQTLEARHELCATLRREQHLREQIQMALLPLSSPACENVAGLIFGEPPPRPAWPWLYRCCALFAVASLVLALMLPKMFVLLVISIALNLLVLFHISPRHRIDFETIGKIGTMLAVADRISKLSSRQDIPQLVALRERHEARQQLARAFRWFSLDRDSALTGSLYWYLNILSLIDFQIFGISIDLLRKHRGELAATFEQLGSLDASIAVAAFMHRLPQHCKPLVTDSPLIDLEAAYHPLIPSPAPNSVRLAGRSALIAGSNMAGKTTFIKMVGINIVLGRTLGLCLAARATIPDSPVMASIRSEHSVAAGKSHYFAEVEAVLRLLQATRNGECRVFLLDELFRGTNTVERVAAAKAVLQALCEQAQVLVTTHDIELQHLLAAHYEMFHFQEDPQSAQFFDFRLRNGASTSRNAIRVLERLGFPPDIIAAALDAVASRGDA